MAKGIASCQELVKQEMEVDRRHDEQLLALQQAAQLGRRTGGVPKWFPEEVEGLSFPVISQVISQVVSQVMFVLQINIMFNI